MTDPTKIRVVLRKSGIGGTEKQRATLRGLGLRRLGEKRVLAVTPAVLGMIGKVRHLVSIEDAGS